MTAEAIASVEVSGSDAPPTPLVLGASDPPADPADPLPEPPDPPLLPAGPKENAAVDDAGAPAEVGAPAPIVASPAAVLPELDVPAPIVPVALVAPVLLPVVEVPAPNIASTADPNAELIVEPALVASPDPIVRSAAAVPPGAGAGADEPAAVPATPAVASTVLEHVVHAPDVVDVGVEVDTVTLVAVLLGPVGPAGSVEVLLPAAAVTSTGDPALPSTVTVPVTGSAAKATLAQASRSSVPAASPPASLKSDRMSGSPCRLASEAANKVQVE